jgi:hypothetical protein
MVIATDRLLTELERQQKYLEILPANFAFPLFNPQRALESQRRSGYRNTAAAVRELVDNALEAGADTVHVIFDSERNSKGRAITTAMAVIDNGSGMLPDMARYALSWGGGTHFEDPSFIGKFGFGLPNASVNQTKRTEVYTRTSVAEPFTNVWLDIVEVTQDGLHAIPEPKIADPPSFVQHYLDDQGIEIGHGTIVVWSHPDRLSYKTSDALREHLLEDFGVTYRYLLGRPAGSSGRPMRILVGGVAVDAVDPLFLLPSARLYAPDTEGGAQLIDDRKFYVRYVADRDTSERHLLKLESIAELDQDDWLLLAHGMIRIRIARFLPGFVAEKELDGRRTDANRRFDIRKTRRGMSFVRARREIDTVDVFPRSGRDRASGLGHWPLLQSYAYHWGVEIRFPPVLDEVFGITNDKQGVRPIEDFWRLLAAERVDEAARRENRWQEQQRKRAPKAETSLTTTAAEHAAATTDLATSSLNSVSPIQFRAAQQRLDEEARARASVTAESIEEAREALEHEASARRYRIAYYDAEDGPFFKPEYVGMQMVIRINRQHPFYQLLYGELLKLPGATRAKEAVDLLLIALGRAELIAPDKQLTLFYEGQRKTQWSSWLAMAMQTLDHQLPLEEDAAT